MCCVGLLDLYEASFDEKWVEWAVELQETQDKLFWDEVGGGYFSGKAGDKDILLRLKEGESLRIVSSSAESLFCR